MAREWPLRQARAQQGPRGSQRDPWGRRLDRGRARRPGPRATDAEGPDRRNVAARPRSRRGAQPRRVGRGRARRPGGWGPWPALSGHGWDPPPKGHAWPPTSRADAQRAEARRAAALGAGATASGDPERAIRRPQAPNRAGAGPAPGWGPRTPPAKRWAAWWPNADPMVRAVPMRNRAEAWPASAPAKKIASPTAQGTQLSNIRAQLLRAWGPASDHRIMAGATLKLQLYYSMVRGKNPDNLDFWQYLHGLCQYCGILLPNWLQIPVTAMAIRAHAPGAVCALLCAAPLGVGGVVWHLRGPCRHSGGRWPPAPRLLI